MKSKMKRVWLFAIMMYIAIGVNAYDTCINGIYYLINSNGVWVTYRTTSGNSYSGDIVIPETIKYNGFTYPVTKIYPGAFDSCTDLTSITFPSSITYIADTWYDCKNLTSIYITDLAAWLHISLRDNLSLSNPLAANSLDHHIFLNGEEITDLVIPNSVTKIRNKEFYYCSSLTSATISNSVTSIGENAFEGCTGLTSVTIPSSVTSIGYYAFKDCKSLNSISIPEGVPWISNGTFYGCNSLTSVTIPNSVRSINGYAFWECI